MTHRRNRHKKKLVRRRARAPIASSKEISTIEQSPVNLDINFAKRVLAASCTVRPKSRPSFLGSDTVSLLPFLILFAVGVWLSSHFVFLAVVKPHGESTDFLSNRINVDLWQLAIVVFAFAAVSCFAICRKHATQWFTSRVTDLSNQIPVEPIPPNSELRAVKDSLDIRLGRLLASFAYRAAAEHKETIPLSLETGRFIPEFAEALRTALLVPSKDADHLLEDLYRQMEASARQNKIHAAWGRLSVDQLGKLSLRIEPLRWASLKTPE